jgi:hypothetical protein
LAKVVQIVPTGHSPQQHEGGVVAERLGRVAFKIAFKHLYCKRKCSGALPNQVSTPVYELNAKTGGGRDGNDPSVDIAKDADQRF